MYMNFNPDPKKPFTDEELATLGIEQIPGALLAFDLRDVGQPYPLAGMNVGPELSPKLLNLVQAAPHMYQQLGRQFAMLQSVIDFLEVVADGTKKATGQVPSFVPHMVNTFTEMQNLILQARRVAVEGPEQVAKEMRAGG